MLLRMVDTAVVVVVMVAAAVVIGMDLKESTAVTTGMQEEAGKEALVPRVQGRTRSGRTAAIRETNCTRVAVTLLSYQRWDQPTFPAAPNLQNICIAPIETRT